MTECFAAVCALGAALFLQEIWARVFAKELYDAKLLSEEGWRRVKVSG